MITELSKINALLTGEIWRRWLFDLAWTENILKINEAGFSKTKMKTHQCKFKPTGDCCGFNDFSSVVWTQNIWCVFGEKTPFSHSFGVVCSSWRRGERKRSITDTSITGCAPTIAYPAEVFVSKRFQRFGLIEPKDLLISSGLLNTVRDRRQFVA